MEKPKPKENIENKFKNEDAPPGIQNINIIKENNDEQLENEKAAEDIQMAYFNEKYNIYRNKPINYKDLFQKDKPIEYKGKIYIKDLLKNNALSDLFFLLLEFKYIINLSPLDGEFVGEDELSNQINVKYFNSNIGYFLRKGDFIIITEPFYQKINNVEFVTCKDIFLFNNKNEANDFIKKNESSLSSLEKSGDYNFDNKEFYYAISYYKDALNVKNVKINENELKNIKGRIHKKIAYTALQLRAFYFALEHCEESLKYYAKNEETLEFKIKSLIGIRKFKDAEDVLNNNINLFKNKKIKNLKKIIQRNINHSEGKFDFLEMLKYEENGTPIEISDYLNLKLELNYDKNHGNKFIAKENISEGELLMVNKAICFFKNHNYNYTNFIYKINDALIIRYDVSKKDFQKIFDLWTPKYNLFTINERQSYFNRNNKDDFSELLAEISIHNSFGVRKSIFQNEFQPAYGKGIWYYFSFLNHNCNPNCFYLAIDDILILISQKCIKKGEEINISYNNLGRSYFINQQFLNQVIHFNCDCELCNIQKNRINDIEFFENFYLKLIEIFLHQHKSNKEVYEKIKKIEKILKKNILEIDYYTLSTFYFTVSLYLDRSIYFNQIEKFLLKAYFIIKGNSFEFECVILSELYNLYIELDLNEKKQTIEKMMLKQFKRLKIFPDDFISLYMKNKVFIERNNNYQKKKQKIINNSLNYKSYFNKFLPNLKNIIPFLIIIIAVIYYIKKN